MFGMLISVWFLTVRRTFDAFKTQLCTIAISLSLFNSLRLPREAFKYGEIPYLVVYSMWLLAAGLPTSLLQLAMGQLSQQDPVGVWRAVPILRGVGHLKLLTSYLCCVYNMLYIALSVAYIIWIGKGSFPLKECTRLHITPYGYENKMNASECFNSTFLAPFTEQPQYLGLMAILIFVLWFFLPIMLLKLRKSLKIALIIFLPIVIIIAVVLCVFLADSEILANMLVTCEHWMPLTQPGIWLSGLVQALLSTHVVSGYLISAGGTVYKHSDVRWTSTFVIITNLLSGWLWVFLWVAISGEGEKDKSIISILVMIYQASMNEKRSKEWPMLAFGLVFATGVISVLALLYPVYDKLHRLTGDHWRLFASATSALGTVLTVAVLVAGMNIVSTIDELVVPVLAVFTTAVEVVGFVFIYGWFYLTVDIQFVTGAKLPCFWLPTWWSTPVLLIGVCGWWLRSLLRTSWAQGQNLWPLCGVFIIILVVMIVMAAIAVAKEEQFNLLTVVMYGSAISYTEALRPQEWQRICIEISRFCVDIYKLQYLSTYHQHGLYAWLPLHDIKKKIASAFRPSRLWGPEEPMSRYVWMSLRFTGEAISSEQDVNSDSNIYPTIKNYTTDIEKKYNEDWFTTHSTYTKTPKSCMKTDLSKEVPPKDVGTVQTIYTLPMKKKKKKDDEKFRSPNICIAKSELGGPVNCNCNRHFTLNAPDLRNTNNEVSTSL